MRYEDMIALIVVFVLTLTSVACIGLLFNIVLAKTIMKLKGDNNKNEEQEKSEDSYHEPDFTINVYDHGNHIAINNSGRDWHYYANSADKGAPLEKQITNALSTYFGWP